MWIWTVLLICGGGVLHLWWRSRYRDALSQIAGMHRLHALLKEQHRQDSERQSARQQSIFDSMMEGVAILDAHGRIESTNLAFRRFLHVTGDLRGKVLEEGVALPEIVRLLHRMRQDGMVLGQEIVLPGQPPRILQANGSRFSGDQGSLVVLHDVTRLKEIERNRKEFVANVSHELRTPISLIKGFVETLQGGAMEDPALARKFLQTIGKHTDRLTYLIEDLLTLSRLEGGIISMNRQEVLLHDVAQAVVDDLRSRSSERRVSVENRIDAGLVVSADPERLKQVFFNLLENAIKYGREEGCVVLGARSLAAGGLEAWVEDDGMGIPEESRARVFERFYRVDRARARDTGGTGLGLAIVKHIIQAHGGEVWVNSELEKGSTFWFSLPAQDTDG